MVQMRRQKDLGQKNNSNSISLIFLPYIFLPKVFSFCNQGAFMDASVPPANEWPALSLHERRVLGVLIEKAKILCRYSAKIRSMILLSLMAGIDSILRQGHLNSVDNVS